MMNSFEREIQNHNQLQKSIVESLTGQNEYQDIVDCLVKAGISEEDMLEKAKYIRREGSKGNYKYIYEEGKDNKGSAEEQDLRNLSNYEVAKKEVQKRIKEQENQNQSEKKDSTQFKIGDTIEHNGKKYKKQANGKWLEVSESHGLTKKEHDHQYNQALMTYQNLGSDRHQKIASEHAKASSKLSDKEHTDEEVGLGKQPSEKKEEYKKGDKFEHEGETIYVGLNTSGGQNTITYKAPSISDKTYWDLNKLKEDIKHSKTQKSAK